MSERRRVFLVEDSPTQAQRLRVFLEAEGLEVVHHETAEAALEQLPTPGADLILLDFHLPGMNGDAFCREIRMNVDTRAIPVLMLTVESSDSAQLHGLESGADDYVAKSADLEVLRYRIHALLRRSRGALPILDVEKRFSKARVLTIDDSPTFRQFIVNELRSEHYSVEAAQSADQAFDLIRELAFDCVLVDFDMPGAGGPDVCRRIRLMQQDPDHEVVLVMVSSHEDKDHITQGFEAGADDYIAKSADIRIVKARIRALLRRKFLVDENRHILSELKERDLRAIRAKSEKEAAELRAMVADRLALANAELERANRKLDLANQELEQFAYAAAHDLQEPLRMIGIYNQLLQAKYGGSLDDTANQYIRFAVDGVHRMDRLIKDLLVYARATKAEDRCAEAVDLNFVLDRALANLRGTIEECGADVSHGPMPRLLVEETRIEQVFQNLVGNAIKYRKKGESPRVRIYSERVGDEWVFTVEDNGIGIDTAQQQLVFGAFKRLHKSEYSGTGLGLAICQRVVQHYGGRIWVESQPGAGSRFRFALAATLAAPTSACAKS